MKLKYLGTAAAEGVPAVFCNCPLCAKAKELGGKDIRSRSQALVNDDLLLDFGPDTLWHVARFGVDLAKIRTLLITHAHEDHYAPSELAYRTHRFAYLNGDLTSDDRDVPKLDVFITKKSYKYHCVKSFEKRYLERGRAPIKFHFAKAFSPFTAGSYTITPLKANHAPGFEAVFYLISDGRSNLLYAHDTGIFPDETFRYLKETQAKLDFVSLDCTGMFSTHNTGGGRHMNLERNLVVRQKLLEAGCADEHTVWCCNHFSHNGKSTHAQLCETLGKEGFLVSYDGMEVEF